MAAVSFVREGFRIGGLTLLDYFWPVAKPHAGPTSRRLPLDRNRASNTFFGSCRAADMTGGSSEERK